MNDINLKEKDIKKLESMKITPEQIKNQINKFKKGTPYVELIKPAVIGDGIKSFTKREKKVYIRTFNKSVYNKKIFKFVPASGAATRMFKNLLYFYNKFKEIKYENIQKKTEQDDDKSKFLTIFIDGLQNKKFAFFNDLKRVMKTDNLKLEEELNKKNIKNILKYLLTSEGLNYASLPKALIKFHSYPGDDRTSLDEHLVEACEYAIGKNQKARLHFTVSPELYDKVKDYIEYIEKKYEMNNVKLEIFLSVQDPSTNTIAVNEDNEPIRDKNGEIVLRPGGHGALLKNLNSIDGDIIFIKNIDNVVPDKLKKQTYEYKKILGGYLLKLQEKILEYQKYINEDNIKKSKLEEIVDFIKKELNLELRDNFKELSKQEKADVLRKKIDRPIRICGMVRNVGDPGGGPFWIKRNGEINLQIVETAQINLNSKSQEKIMNSATHFNPVDIVCGIKNYKGEKYDLSGFVDHNTYFVTHKSKKGEPLKALELPGLWNGSMADWITLFVEVPPITFNPVKTVNDLLKNEHQV